MDKRGLTVDPNREACASLAWYETIGPTHRPSPYATASWKYLQNYTVVLVESCDQETSIGFDNWRDFSVWLYEFVLDGGELYQYDLDKPVYDGGGARSGSFIKHIFSSVKVYDSFASSPGVFGNLDIDLGLLAIDSDGVAVEVPVAINPITIGFDNGDNMQVPIPNPQVIWDGGTFAQWGQGTVLDNGGWEIINGVEQPVTYVDQVFNDGDLLSSEQNSRSSFFLEISRNAVPSDDQSPGKLLGELNYEMVNCKVSITDWSHYNWRDDTPVRKAFKAMVNSLPKEVLEISVRDTPQAFWTSMGFTKKNKGDSVLYYNDPKKYQTY